MCGRYVVARTLSGALPDLLENIEGWDPDFENYNIPPTTEVPIVIEEAGVAAAEASRHVNWAHWGLVPSWKKVFDQRPQPINARLESAATNGMFRRAYQRGHCLVPASGYYEWRVNADGSKQPFFIHAPEGRGLAMAGLYEDWIPSGDKDTTSLSRRTMAILTREAVGPAREIHDRMPVMLAPADYSTWLGSTTLVPAKLDDFLDRASSSVAQTLVADPVSRDVGNVRNNGPDLITPVEA